MVEAKHTPTLHWTRHPSDKDFHKPAKYAQLYTHAGGGAVALVKKDEDAARLTLAWNSHDALVAENQALRNLANNLQPGPISEALVGARHERESALVAALEDARLRFANLSDAAYACGLYATAVECGYGRDAAEAAFKAAKGDGRG